MTTRFRPLKVTAVLSKSPTAVLDRWECPIVNRDSYTYTSSSSSFWIGPLKVSDWWKSPTCWQRPSVLLKASYVLDRWNVPVLSKCPARLGLVLNRLDLLDRWRSPGERVFSVLDRWKRPPCRTVWTAKRVWLKVSFTIGAELCRLSVGTRSRSVS